MPLPDARRRSRGEAAEMKTGGGEGKEEGQSPPQYTGKRKLWSGAITFLMPRFRIGVPWSRRWVARKILLPEVEKDGTAGEKRKRMKKRERGGERE